MTDTYGLKGENIFQRNINYKLHVVVDVKQSVPNKPTSQNAATSPSLSAAGSVANRVLLYFFAVTRRNEVSDTAVKELNLIYEPADKIYNY